MSRHRRRSGPAFWIGTFLIGIFSPSKGKRRIDAEMKQLNACIADLREDKKVLLQQLAEITIERDCLRILIAGDHDSKNVTMDNGSERTVTIPVHTPHDTAKESDNTKLTSQEPEAMSLK